MKKMNLKKIVLSLAVVIAVFGLVGYLMKNRNQETIVDLGNGWKSYSNEKLGFTVKISEDAEIEAGKTGSKNENFTATFSKGDIDYIRTMYCCGMRGFGDPNNTEDVHRYYDVHNDKDYNWKYSSSNKENVDFSREIIIDNKVVTFDFSLTPFPEEGNGSDSLRLVVFGPEVIGKGRLHIIGFKSIDIIIPKVAEDGTPRLKEEIEGDIEEFVNKKIELVKDLVISINNF